MQASLTAPIQTELYLYWQINIYVYKLLYNWLPVFKIIKGLPHNIRKQ